MNRLFLHVLTLALFVLLMAACGPSQAQLDSTVTHVAAGFFGTKTAWALTVTATFTPSPIATATATATPKPTDTPTITPTPTPELMAAVLTLEDLPDGYQPLAAEGLSTLQKSAPENAIAFGFSNEANSQTVMGYLIPYPSQSEQIAFDEALPDMLDMFATAYGATTTPEAITGLDDLGVARAASTFVAGGGDVPARWDNILFRHGEVGVFLFAVYPDGTEMEVSSGDLARIIDGRIGKLLPSQTTKVVTVWRDEFDNKISEPWFWINENATLWSLTERPGFLRMYASSNTSKKENRLLRPVAQGDFTIETHQIFEPDTNFQFAGLAIYQDADSYLAFGRAFCDTPGACVGNGIYFDAILGGKGGGSNFGTLVDRPGEAYLRLVRRGNQVTGFYSSNGTSWKEIGTHEIPSDFQVNGVGLIASGDFNTPDRDIPAYFDFFKLSENE